MHEHICGNYQNFFKLFSYDGNNDTFVRWIDRKGTNDNLVVHCPNMKEINDSFGCSFQWYDELYWKLCCSLHIYFGDLWEVLFFFSLIWCGLMTLSVESFIHMLVSNDNCLYQEWYEGEECQFFSFLTLLWWRFIIYFVVICTDIMWFKDKFDVPWTDMMAANDIYVWSSHKYYWKNGFVFKLH